VYALGSSCVFEKISVAFALVPAFWCASRLVIQAFVLFLLCVAPHPVLGFLTGPCPVGCAGRSHYNDDQQVFDPRRCLGEGPEQVQTQIQQGLRRAKGLEVVCLVSLADAVPWALSAVGYEGVDVHHHRFRIRLPSH